MGFRLRALIAALLSLLVADLAAEDWPQFRGPGGQGHSSETTAPLVWSGGKLPLILDHINGNNSDNRPKNLRLVCPNCNAQLATHGGGNIGKIEKAEGGFAIISKPDGVWHYVLPAEGPTDEKSKTESRR